MSMRSKIIHDADGERTFAVILEIGDEIVASLNAFAQAHELEAGSFKAIGALSRATLAFFDWEAKEYLPIPVEEQVEVASLTGDIATGPDGKPALHIHAVLGKRDGSAVAGHLQAGTVRPTLEVILTEASGHLRKRFDPDVGIAMIDPAL
jgi:predicted DNA-binding protein with PD1-like motif